MITKSYVMWELRDRIALLSYESITLAQGNDSLLAEYLNRINELKFALDLVEQIDNDKPVSKRVINY